MSHISVLGGGWLGLPLTQELSKSQQSVKVSTRETKLGLNTDNIEEFTVDIRQLSSDISKFLSCEILIVNIPSKDIDSFKSLVKKIETSSIKKVLFISSTSVCHNQNSPLLEIEKLFTDSTSFQSTVIRFSGLIGYSRNPANFFKNREVVLKANERVNLIHRDDCINIIKSILKQNIWGETFNACADTHPTKKEFYSHVCTLQNIQVPKFTDKGDAKSIIDNTKLKKALDYEFIHPSLMDIDF